MRVSVKALVLVCAFVCPLLFFTDLTRNPYISQIVLLDLCLVGVLAVYAVSQAREPAWSLPRTPMDAPLAAWILLCVFSWAWSYWRHEPFYRDAILSEGDRLFGFSFINATLLNALLPFYIAVFYVRGAPARPGFGAGRWVAFILVWGLLWAPFPFLRSPAGPLARTWPHLWDP